MFSVTQAMALVAAVVAQAERCRILPANHSAAPDAFESQRASGKACQFDASMRHAGTMPKPVVEVQALPNLKVNQRHRVFIDPACASPESRQPGIVKMGEASRETGSLPLVYFAYRSVYFGF